MQNQGYFTYLEEVSLPLLTFPLPFLLLLLVWPQNFTAFSQNKYLLSPVLIDKPHTSLIHLRPYTFHFPFLARDIYFNHETPIGYR
jgi:hypothetical protein